LEDEIMTGSSSAFVRARPTALLLISAAVLVSRVLDINPIWWSIRRTILLPMVGLSWPNRPDHPRPGLDAGTNVLVNDFPGARTRTISFTAI
jgi:hypothetical protein